MNLIFQALKVPGGYFCDNGTGLTIYGTCQTGFNCIHSSQYILLSGVDTYYCECLDTNQVLFL